MKRVAEETDVKEGMRARIQRGGKRYVLPFRESEEDWARDQELLNAIGKDVVGAELEVAVEEVRKQREKEVLESVAEETDVKEDKRARIQRGGKRYALPFREAT